MRDEERRLHNLEIKQGENGVAPLLVQQQQTAIDARRLLGRTMREAATAPTLADRHREHGA
jgi:hypothetical protein